MKKITFTILGAILAIGIGASAFAAETVDKNGTFNFGQMLPLMQQMHPDYSTEQLKEMYNSCHGTNGAAPSANFENMPMNMQGMMGL